MTVETRLATVATKLTVFERARLALRSDFAGGALDADMRRVLKPEEPECRRIIEAVHEANQAIYQACSYLVEWLYQEEIQPGWLRCLDAMLARDATLREGLAAAGWTAFSRPRQTCGRAFEREPSEGRCAACAPWAAPIAPSRGAAAAGTTVFLSSHVMGEVEQVCRRVGILRAGRLAAVEPIAALKGKQLRHVEISFGDVAPPERTFAPPGVRELRRDNATVEFEVAGEIDVLIKAVAPYRILDLRTEQATLDEVLMSYYRDGAA